ncbi:MAG: hypothetical protein ACLSVG_02745 [Clostridia bacterium]
MKSILNEIVKLRGEQMPVIDYHNSNRYCVIAAEKDGSKTSYCFGIPVYNRKTRRIIDLLFHETEGKWKADGSTAVITAGNEIYLENPDGFSKVALPERISAGAERCLRYGMAEIRPTLNGVCVRAVCTADQTYEIDLITGQPFMNVRANDRCFSLMQEEHRPFMTVSCIGVLNDFGQIIAPCIFEYQRYRDNAYTLIFRQSSPYGSTLLFEINLYEEKLFQDTTVESLHPDLNNAFGGTAFIGNTAAYGEQWLYSRPDFAKLPELYDKQIRKAIFHLPRFGGNCTFSAFGLSARFCSFGSNWDNKIEAAEEQAIAYTDGAYQSLDITSLITDNAGFLKHTEGLILRPKKKNGGFAAVSTGDSYFAPQILEVNFR